MKWEYMSIVTSKNPSDSLLDKYGDDGWELVSVVLLGDGLTFYFKRPRPSWDRE